ncbi:malto-oligosyltrehalose synthase [Mangrovicoccus algicola]|uniref:Malto-oligosyltrehalose synthase n=1 Tax=Mangrovicoccus algicola TaxID=2771008 RepID=A0A8J7CG55_9RHOB|nr:malto-oligosyltrehalose synthase [Mangrovicoccus algicola]MBE3636810.1 malto-oligosyltrehalose synthase [Mangrovicoccus algicola]
MTQHDPVEGPARPCAPPCLNAATATYRLQLRGGLDFAAAEGWLDYLADLGISHLYLSPVFTAVPGSSHGYDVTRPDEIDPALGGRAGFERLARHAHALGIGLILDIVPNHTALSLHNPWLRDVLRHGAASRYAGHFDIDRAAGPLRLCWLSAPLPVVLETEDAHLAEEPDGPVLRVAGLSVPLHPASLRGMRPGPLALAEALALHEAQSWRLTPWQTERDSITHRRFFNVTSLIGMRVEDPQVFADMHGLIFDLCDAGLVQGLRIDHVDGLADPQGYLDALHARLPGTPLWVEKILSGDEALDIGWPVCGTTGYEAGRAIAAVLSDPLGVARLQAGWAARTGREGRFHDVLMAAKPEVLVNELAAELHHLVALAGRAVAEDGRIGAGPEALREALAALLCRMPRYRTYFSDREPRDEDRALWRRVSAEAAAALRDGTVVRVLARLIETGRGPAAAALRVRFQQVSGALIAKSLEDTAGFRHVPYLAANEVGAEPDEPVLSPEGFAAFCRTHAHLWPAGLVLTSSHDTKRSEDARMRLVAAGHLPEAFLALEAAVAARPDAGDIPRPVLWYLAKSAVAAWDPADPELGERLAAHMEKAMREAKEFSFWTRPVPEAEAPVTALARALAASWQAAPPAELLALARRGAALSLCQLALKLTMPGIPDLYRGTEAGRCELTDPDNRRPVDPQALAGLARQDGPEAAKARLARRMLALRGRFPALFSAAEFRARHEGEGLLVEREDGEGRLLRVTLDPSADPGRAVLVEISPPGGAPS